VLIYASETWALSEQDEYILTTSERKILRTIYGAVKQGNEWKIRYNQELYDMYGCNNAYKGETAEMGRTHSSNE
jgi:hypothetical protein